MCGRYTLIPTKNFYNRFDIVGTGRDLSLPNRYNIAPGQTMPVITHNSPNKIELMRWGLIPSWAKDPKIAYHTINAKVETVAIKPAFRSSFKTKRCLIPASGFYEWKRIGPRQKQPYYFHLKDQEMFAFAGLYDIWNNEKGEELKTYTIITTAANALVNQIHARMPVILSRDAERIWLDNNVGSKDLCPLLKPFPADSMLCHPVSSLVNDANIDEETLIKSI